MEANSEIATKIIQSAFYMTTATCADNVPWISPTIFWTDDKLSFYLVSHIDSRHIQQIEKNNKVAVSIYDSTQPEGTGRGLQFGGTATVLKDENEMSNAIKWLFLQRLSNEGKMEDFISEKQKIYKNNNRFIAKIDIDKEGIFINEWDGKDYRVPVKVPSDIKLKQFRK